MDEALKQQIKKSMNDWLTEKGWPDKFTDNQIIQSLPKLWKHLESEKLLIEVRKKGFTYAQFVNVAIQAKNNADIKRAFMEKMNGFGFWK